MKTLKTISLFILGLLPCPLAFCGNYQINSFYPAPFGVYDDMILYPQSDASMSCNSDDAGLLYFSDEQQTLLLCTDTGLFAPANVVTPMASSIVLTSGATCNRIVPSS